MKKFVHRFLYILFFVSSIVGSAIAAVLLPIVYLFFDINPVKRFLDWMGAIENKYFPEA